MRHYYVYIMASRSRTLYVGVTGNLTRRICEHKAHKASEFTAKYRIERLVYAEEMADVGAAIVREKQIKAWRREKKVELISQANPGWADIAEGWCEEG